MSNYLFAQTNDVALLIEEGPEGVFLYSIKPNSFVGDTWHRNLDQAKEQAALNAGEIVGPWRGVPSEFGDKLKTGKTKP